MDEIRSREGGGSPPPLRRTRATRAREDDAAIAELDDRVEELLDLLGKAHALAILRLFALEGGPWRFSELEERLDASPHTLSERLSELTEAGLIERRSYDEIPPRVEYTWTPPARDLSPAFHFLYDWALENDLAPVEATT